MSGLVRDDIARGVIPSPRRITRAWFPHPPGLRVDTQTTSGAMNPPFHDSMIAWWPTRAEAIAVMQDALRVCTMEGVHANAALYRAIMGDTAFAKGSVDTKYLGGPFSSRTEGGKKMTNVSLIYTTVRDGNQSNRGARGPDTGMMQQITPVMARIGFEAIDLTTSTHMAVAVRVKQKDSSERLRLFHEAMPNTPLSFLTTGIRFISCEVASEELMEWAFRLLVQNGIRRFAVMDPMNNVPMMSNKAGITRRAGGEQIVVALKTVCGSGRIEFHSHTTIGLAAFTCLESVNHGVDCRHTSAASAANGTGQPAMPMDANVEDRIKSSKRVKVLEDETRMTSPGELRAMIVRHHSGDECLLHVVIPADQVDTMVKAGPARRTYDPETHSVPD